MIKRIISFVMCAIVFVMAIPMTTVADDSETIAALEARIAELEAEVTMLRDRQEKLNARAEIVMFASDKIERCDINGDGSIDAVDASLILQAYALISTGEDIRKISDVINYEFQKQFEEELKNAKT